MSTDTPRTRVTRQYWYTDNQGGARFCCDVNDVYALELELAAKDLEIATKDKAISRKQELIRIWEKQLSEATLRAESAEMDLGKAKREARDATARVTELERQLAEAGKLCKHGIPFYAYGDNQAACELANRIEQISDRLDAARALKEGV